MLDRYTPRTHRRNLLTSTDRGGLSSAGHLLLLLAALALLFTRRPDAFTNPQFWAEDGAVWYADAFRMGPWRPLAIPNAGYLQTSSRLGAALTLLAPARWAPAVMNAIALLIQVLPVGLLASRRFADVPLRARLAAGAVYLALPNSWEVHANLTNSQWRVGLILVLLLAGSRPRTVAGRAFEAAIAFVAALSGPFGILALPVVLLRWLQTRERGFLPIAAATVAGSLLQVVVLWTHRAARIGGPLAASLEDGIRIVGGQVALGALVGEHWLRRIVEQPWGLVLCAVATALFLVVAFEIAAGAPRALQALGVWAGSILVAGMLWPVGNGPLPAWPFLARPGNNGRYWFAPMLVFLAGLAWLALRGRGRMLRAVAAIALVLLPIGVVSDWRYEPYADLDWRRHAVQVEGAPPGTELRVPINPSGVTMRLVR